MSKNLENDFAWYLRDKARAEKRDPYVYPAHWKALARNDFLNDPKVQEQLFGVGNARYENESTEMWQRRMGYATNPNRMAPMYQGPSYPNANKLNLYKQHQYAQYQHPQGPDYTGMPPVVVNPRQLFPTAGVIPLHLRLG